MTPRSKKAKGTRLEKWIVRQLSSIGVTCRRQPGSGIYQDFPHDCWADIPGFGPVVMEAKSWKNGWRTGDKALGGCGLLIIKRDYAEPRIYMPWSTFEGLVKALAEANEAGEP